MHAPRAVRKSSRHAPRAVAWFAMSRITPVVRKIVVPALAGMPAT